MTPIAFPLSGSFKVNAIGAAPIVAFVNTGDNPGAGGGYGLGNPDLVGVTTPLLAQFLDGSQTTADALFSSAEAAGVVNVATFIREPLSGTYNTCEYCIPNTLETGLSQEDGWANNGNPNPLNTATWSLSGGVGSFTSGGQVRAIGTGAMVADVNATKDALGYAFWSFGNFKGATSCKYLDLDGADPLFDPQHVNPVSAGHLPQSGDARPTFGNLINGGYRAWSILRLISPTSVGIDYAGILSKASGEDSGGDFVAASALKVFRSHRPTIDVSIIHTSNGNAGEPAEAGSDMGGAVFTVNADLDAFAAGAQLINLRQ